MLHGFHACKKRSGGGIALLFFLFLFLFFAAVWRKWATLFEDIIRWIIIPENLSHHWLVARAHGSWSSASDSTREFWIPAEHFITIIRWHFSKKNTQEPEKWKALSDVTMEQNPKWTSIAMSIQQFYRGIRIPISSNYLCFVSKAPYYLSEL